MKHLPCAVQVGAEMRAVWPRVCAEVRWCVRFERAHLGYRHIQYHDLKREENTSFVYQKRVVSGES